MALMKKSVLDLEFRLMKTERPGAGEISRRDNAFRLWRQNWVQTFEELGVERRLNSDDFLHRELGGLFLGDHPVGFMLYHFLDLQDEVWRESAYFNNYPSQLKALHEARPERVMVISYMTLQTDWRKSETDLPISELLTSFAVLRFLASDAKRLIGYFRNNRRTNEMFYRHGGKPLVKESRAYNVEVDFAEILQHEARLSSLEGCGEAALELWNRYLHGPSQGERNGNVESIDGPPDRETKFLRLDK